MAGSGIQLILLPRLLTANSLSDTSYQGDG